MGTKTFIHIIVGILAGTMVMIFGYHLVQLLTWCICILLDTIFNRPEVLLVILGFVFGLIYGVKKLKLWR